MDISIVIVTRNRAQYVAGALLSLSQLDFPMGDFEVIVADNGSTDSTAEVCSTYEKFFETPEQVWEYAQAILPPKRSDRANRGRSLPVLSGVV
jgi:GT2 family glycosyltransferase